jgi:fructokinase
MVSRDLFGDQIFNYLRDNGVGTGYIRRTEKATTLGFVKMTPGDDPRYAFYCENSADRSLSPEDIPENLDSTVRCIQFGSISLNLEPGAATIRKLIKREAGKRVLSFDPNIRPEMISDRQCYLAYFEELAGLTTILKISSADLEWLYPGLGTAATAEKLLSLGCPLVVITLGEKGALARSQGLSLAVDGYPVKVSDTVGAGDSFHGALLAELYEQGLLEIGRIESLSKKQLQRALDFAAKAAAVTCSREGADPPTRELLI